MKVIFRQFNHTKKDYEVEAELSLVDNALEWTIKASPELKSLIEGGVVVESLEGSKRIMPDEDPVKYLKALPSNFSGTYFRAELVDDETVNKSFNFSIQDTGAQGETGNNNGYPIKVDGVKEQQKRTPQRDNSEPYYEKSSIVNDWFYSLTPGMSRNTALAELKSTLVSKSLFSTTDFSEVANIFKGSTTLFQFKKDLDRWMNKSR
jgi:hypothetical protein